MSLPKTFDDRAGKLRDDAPKRRPGPDGVIRGRMVYLGHEVDLAILPPGAESPEPGPGLGRTIVDLSGGYRMAILSRGPAAGVRAARDRAAVRLGLDGWDHDQDQAEDFDEVGAREGGGV